MNKIGSFIVSTSFVLGASVLPFTSAGLEQAEAATIVKINHVSYQTTSNVKLLAGTYSNARFIITIPKGKTVIATEQEGSWYKVSYTYLSGGKTKTVTGWVKGSLKKSSSGTSTLSTAVQLVKFVKTTYQTTKSSLLYSGAGTSYKTLYKVPTGGIVTSLEKKGNWYHAYYTYFSKGKTVTQSGWISGNNLKEYDLYKTTSVSYYFTNKTASLYSNPDTKSKVVFQVASGNGLYSTQKVVNSTGQTWYKVTYNGKSLFVNSSDVKLYTPKSFTKTTYKANTDPYVYQYPGFAFTKLVKLPKGTVITSSKSVGSWFTVTYQGKTGFVLGKYISKVTTGTSQNTVTKETVSGETYLVTADLNLRKTNVVAADNWLATIPNGTTVTPILKTSNGWFLIKYNGQTGYVSGTFLKKYNRTDDYRFIDLRTQAPVTAKQINDYIAQKVNGRDSVLLGSGQAFINAGKKYGVNALYLAAHAIHESNFGMSGISLGKYNLFGYGAYDATPFIGAYRFASVADCINYVAQQIKANYLDPNGVYFQGPFLGYRTNTSSLARVDSQSVGMNYFYATDANWGNAIAQHMQNILAYNKAYYATAKSNTTTWNSPGIPAGSDVFPAGIQAVAKTTLSTDIKAGTKFVLLEKSNDFRIKVKVGNKAPTWIGPIAFSHYTDYFSALNLGRVTATVLNVRSKASTGSSILSQLNLDSYVQFVLDSKGKIITDSSKNWYQIKLSNGNTGWVYADFIYRELQ